MGINRYQADLPLLSGCVNDVKAIQRYLESRAQDGYFNLELDVLTSGDPENPQERKPTRQAVIDSFRRTLAQAKAGDTALFYFSGHGSQEKAPPQFWDLEPDHLDETLVCFDSRSPGNWDLADKELAVLISEVAGDDPAVESPHILVVLDACHSGSGTRDPLGSQARLAPQDARDRPVETFLPELTARLKIFAQEAEPGASSPSNWVSLPSGRHVVLSACRAEESAREKGMRDEQNHGVFSFFLLDTLQQVGPAPTYRDIFERTSSLVRGQVKDQNPVLESVHSGDILLPFLGGEARPDTQDTLPYFNLYYERNEGWFISGGAVHGILPPTGSETTFMKLFPLEHSVHPGESMDSAVGDAQVIEVLGTRSRVLPVLKDGKQPGLTEFYKGVVVSSPLPPCPVFISGSDQEAIQDVAQRIEQSPMLVVVANPGQATFKVSTDNNSQFFYLQRGGDLQPLQVVVGGKGTSQALDEVVMKLEHMASWLQKLELENHQSGIPAEAVQMQVFKYDPDTGERLEITSLSSQQASTPLSYDPQESEWGVPLQIRIHHTGTYPKDLYVMLVDMTEDYAVLTGDFLFGGGTWLKPGEETWAVDPSNGDPFIYVRVRPELVQQGVTRFHDVLKMVVSTDASNADLLAQDPLQVAVRQAGTRGGMEDRSIPASTLHRIMKRVHTRDVGGGPPRGKLSDWRTLARSLVTECTGGAVQLARAPGSLAELAAGVSIEAHSGLNARAQLLTYETGKRDLGNLSLPAMFRENPQQFQPFSLSSGALAASRGDIEPAAMPVGGGDAGSSVIVLNDVTGSERVMPGSPLVIHVQAELSQGEIILPVGYDPQIRMFLPLGVGWQEGKRVKIQVNHLPSPSSDSRSLAGSIKLFFQKFVAEKTGIDHLAGKSHLLAVARCLPNGEVEYQDDPQAIREQTAKSQNILLLLHGLFGDTAAMVKSLNGHPPGPVTPGEGLAGRYDLTLTFDYENIYTSIEETALELKKQLVDIAGLAPGHTKTMHVVAHSLGAQVIRYFIERDEGDRIIQKAVLLGTPNAGTPWAVYQDYAIYALAAVLNGLVSLISGPAAIVTLAGSLVSIVKGVEEVDTTLDQLKPGSQFYKILNASGDPHVTYYVVAGNTSLIQYDREATFVAKKQALNNLVEKLVSQKTLHNILSLGFLNKPNDMAVSLESQFALPLKRDPAPHLVEIACDHFSYFTSEVGLNAIQEALDG